MQTKRPIVLVVLIVAVTGVIAIWATKTSEQYTQPVVLAPPNITLDQFRSLPDGATYNHVLALLGRPGTEISRNVIADYVTVMYQWQNDDHSNMSVMFQNDRLVNKSQFGLK
jgi:hypothetical protein